MRPFSTNIWILIGLSAVVIAGCLLFRHEANKASVNSYADCANAGYPILETYPEQCKTPDGRTFVRTIDPQSAEFGNVTNLQLVGKIEFADGLTVSLSAIDDSRCKQGVVCVWAGELSPLLAVSGGNAGEVPQNIRLGTTTAPSVISYSYKFDLISATEIDISLRVSKTEFTSSGMTRSVTLSEGQQEGPLLVQKIYPSYVMGLSYREYPVATDHGSPITLKVGESVSNGCTVTLTLISIQNGSATFKEVTDNTRTCPICLAEGTLIDTPNGKIAVQDIRRGAEVWTTDVYGKRIAAKVILAAKTQVPATHKVVRLILADDRELLVSPGHPTADGRLIGNLLPGDVLDHSIIKVAEVISYSYQYTYDILPLGVTGRYWANDILIGSTLFKN